MKLEQALQIIKQALDAALKIGVCQNLESSAALSQAWAVLANELKDKINESTH